MESIIRQNRHWNPACYLLTSIRICIVEFTQMNSVFVLGEIMIVLGLSLELEWFFLRLGGHKKQVSAGFALK